MFHFIISSKYSSGFVKVLLAFFEQLRELYNCVKINRIYYNEAIECYDKILKVTDNFNVLFFKSASLLILNKYEEALKYCNYALELEPENCDANGLKQLIKYKIAQK